jgi:putative redox protein
MKSKVKLIEGMQFVGTADSGHAVIMDAPPSVGGADTGARPSELLLMALGGCSGMDVVSILRKKKQEITNVEVHVTGETQQEHPRYFTDIHIEYAVTGRNISEDAVKRAVGLSLDKYCMVGTTIAKGARITHSSTIIEDDSGE